MPEPPPTSISLVPTHHGSDDKRLSNLSFQSQETDVNSKIHDDSLMVLTSSCMRWVLVFDANIQH